jgi:hypothetical protein
MAIHYKEFERAAVQPSKSSLGKWVVRTSEITYRFFEDRSQATLYCNAFNVKRHADSCGQCSKAVYEATGNLCSIGRTI